MTDKEQMNAIIQAYKLESHGEGGYFRLTYESGAKIPQGENDRYAMTSILYMAHDAARIVPFHVNKSDVVHYFHTGHPMTLYLLDPATKALSTVVMGHDVAAGHQMQVTVRAGIFKATHLPEGDYGLISEAVCPGFEFADMVFGTKAEFQADFPELYPQIEKFIKE